METTNDIKSGALSREYSLLLSDVDRFRRLRLSVLFRMFQDLSVIHAESLGVGREKTRDRGFVWIVSKVGLDVSRLPEYGEDVTLKTWPGKTGHVLFARYYLLESAAGETLARASSLWALMDYEKRTPVIPKDHGIFVADASSGGELPLPGPLRRPPAEESFSRAVLYSETDMNGHMNNSRYLDWADDCLDSDFHRDRALKELQINFLAEAVQGTVVRLEKSLSDGRFFLRGVSEDEDKKDVFALRALYLRPAGVIIDHK